MASNRCAHCASMPQRASKFGRKRSSCSPKRRRGIRRRTATPVLITVNGKQQVISVGSGVVSAFAADSGKEIWRVRHNGYSVIPRPVFGHGLVFVSTGYDAATLLAIRPDGQGDVTATHIAWT